MLSLVIVPEPDRGLCARTSNAVRLRPKQGGQSSAAAGFDLLLLRHHVSALAERTFLLVWHSLAGGNLDLGSSSCVVMPLLLTCPHDGKTVAGETRDKVDMKMEHCLSGIDTRGELSVEIEVDRAWQWLLEMLRCFAHQLTGILHRTTDCSGGHSRVLCAVLDMLLGDDKHMARCAGVERNETDNIVPFFDHRCRKLTSQDLAERA